MYVIWFKTIQCMYEEEKRIENWVGVDETRLEWVDHCSSWLVGTWEFIMLFFQRVYIFKISRTSLGVFKNAPHQKKNFKKHFFKR